MRVFIEDCPFRDPYEWRYCFHSGAGHQQRQQATSDLAQQGQLTGAAQGTLGQFEGPVQQSPFYKALLNTGIQSTSQAYDNAASNMRQRANAAGFGYTQPVEQGAESQLRTQEAKTMAELPQQTALEATGPALSAAGQTGALGMGYGQQGAGLLGANAANNMGLYQALLGIYGQAARGAGAAAAGG